MQNITITRRDGTKADIDITKIRNVVNWACEGLDANPITLEAKLNTRLNDGVTTREIQDNLIDCALGMCNPEEPDWRYVAGRLHIWSLWKDTKVSRGYQYGNYYQTVKTHTDNLLYDNRILSYTNQEIETASTWINPDWDLDYDYAGAVMLTKRYLLPDELPQEALLTCALLIASVEKLPDTRMKWAKRIYEAIAQRKISLATPILANLRVPGGSLASCFICAMDDNLESIFHEITNAARISKNGGGVGMNVSRIRATGSKVMSKENASGGVLPWVKLLNDTAIAVNQGSRRAGAITVSLDIWHLDIPDFLECQTEAGDLRRKSFDIFPQLVIPDEFMVRVKESRDWTLVDPYEVKQVLGIDLAALWGSEFVEAYRQIEAFCDSGKLKLFHRIDARELFKTAMKTQVETGLPYMNFKDTINRANPNNHDGYIPGGNLCVAPETLILTRDGQIPIVDLVGQKVDVWNGAEWSNVLIRKTGENQELVRVIVRIETTNLDYPDEPLTETVTLDCTPYHHFWIIRKGEIMQIEACELTPYDVLEHWNLPDGSMVEFSDVIAIEQTHRFSDTYCFTEPKRNRGTFNGIVTGQCQESWSNVKPGELAHTCNLNSLNLANIQISDGADELAYHCETSVRILDNTIELTNPPFQESENHNDRYRTIGIGVMGLADCIAKHAFSYTDLSFINVLFEEIAYQCTNASMELAKERGAYPAFPGSQWSKGNMLGAKSLDEIQARSHNPERWAKLSSDIQVYGIRNSHITAIAPNTSSSLVQGCTASILPTYSRFFYDKWAKGVVPIAPPFIKDSFWYYPESKNMNQKIIVDAVATMQFWIDTGISMELLFNLNKGVYFPDEPDRAINAKDIFETLVYAWEKGCKAIYYIRTVQKDDFQKSDYCSSCAN